MALAGYCLDTDILIDYLRGVDDARLFLIAVSAEAPVFINTITIVELFAGRSTRRSRIRRGLAKLLESFTPIQLTASLARQAGELRRDYHIPFADAIVAAGAISYHLTIVSRNRKHFARVKDLLIRVPY